MGGMAQFVWWSLAVPVAIVVGIFIGGASVGLVELIVETRQDRMNEIAKLNFPEVPR